MSEVDLKRRQQELLLIQKYLDIVKEAGFGEVIVHVQNGHIVNIEHKAQRGLKLR